MRSRTMACTVSFASSAKGRLDLEEVELPMVKCHDFRDACWGFAAAATGETNLGEGETLGELRERLYALLRSLVEAEALLMKPA